MFGLGLSLGWLNGLTFSTLFNNRSQIYDEETIREVIREEKQQEEELNNTVNNIVDADNKFKKELNRIINSMMEHRIDYEHLNINDKNYVDHCDNVYYHSDSGIYYSFGPLVDYIKNYNPIVHDYEQIFHHYKYIILNDFFRNDDFFKDIENREKIYGKFPISWFHGYEEWHKCNFRNDIEERLNKILPFKETIDLQKLLLNIVNECGENNKELIEKTIKKFLEIKIGKVFEEYRQEMEKRLGE